MSDRLENLPSTDTLESARQFAIQLSIVAGPNDVRSDLLVGSAGNIAFKSQQVEPPYLGYTSSQIQTLAPIVLTNLPDITPENPLYQRIQGLIDEQRQIALFKEAQRLSILPNGRFLAQMRPIRKSIYYSLEEACAAVPTNYQPGIELVFLRSPKILIFHNRVQKIKTV